VAVATLLTVSAGAKTLAQKKQAAQSQFELAERLRNVLNGRAASDRTRREYNHVIEAYRIVYYTAPGSSKADASVMAVGELMTESGRQFRDEKTLRSAIGQFQFLRREYPGSRYRVKALLTIAEIYKNDLDDDRQARATYEDFLKRYPGSELIANARAGLAELNGESKQAAKVKTPPESSTSERVSGQPRAAAPTSSTSDTASAKRSNKRDKMVEVTGIRHWSTPDSTRVAIDLNDTVDYQSGRVPNPERVFFDLHNTHLLSTLKGKSIDIENSALHKVRVAQYQQGETRVVLDVDEGAQYSASLQKKPYRLIIDVSSKSRAATPENAFGAPSSDKSPAPRVASGEKSSELRVASSEDSPESRAASPEKSSELQVPSSRSRTENRKPKTENPGNVAKLNPPESLKSKTKKAAEPPPGHEAKPTAHGERSLTRALGLKIGRIVVDAGHGGHDTGTIGANGLLEKDLVLDVALRLGKLLESRMGAEVVYTRNDDTFIPLETRTAIANQTEADLFISIHANSSGDPAARGIETYYLNFTTSKDALEVAARENAVSDKTIHELQDLVKKIALKDKMDESREFAVDVQQSLFNGLATQGMRNRGVKKAPFIVLIGANMPSILAEISFVSNPSDAKRLRTPEYRQKIAESLYRGTAKYVNGLSGLKVASKGSKPDMMPVSASTPPRSMPASSSSNE